MDRNIYTLSVLTLRRIFGPKRDEVTGGGENYVMRGLMICSAHQIVFG
jgi:hypothetical protein